MKIILGLAGEMASGKGTVAKYAATKYGAKSWRFSTMLRDVLDRLLLEQSRDNLQNLSTVLRQNFGEELWTNFANYPATVQVIVYPERHATSWKNAKIWRHI